MRNLWTLSAGVVGLLLWSAAALAQPARAGYVSVFDPPSGELTHAQILGAIYTGGTTWQALNGGEQVGFSGGDGLAAVRVHDTGLAGPLDVTQVPPPLATDQVWTGDAITARAQARYAAYEQAFGYDLLGDDQGYIRIFDVLGEGMNVTGSAEVQFTPGQEWLWGLSGSPQTWLSSTLENPDGMDHLVTYRLLGLSDGLEHWVLFWEDLPGLGDADFNDLVVEITAAPEPSALFLVLAGIGLSGLRKWRAR